MIINKTTFDNLTAQAKTSPRFRMHLDLRNSEDDHSQRILNAIEPGSPERIHRHRHTSETVVCLRGRVYDDLVRMCTNAIELHAGWPQRCHQHPHRPMALDQGARKWNGGTGSKGRTV